MTIQLIRKPAETQYKCSWWFTIRFGLVRSSDRSHNRGWGLSMVGWPMFMSLFEVEQGQSPAAPRFSRCPKQRQSVSLKKGRFLVSGCHPDGRLRHSLCVYTHFLLNRETISARFVKRVSSSVSTNNSWVFSTIISPYLLRNLSLKRRFNNFLRC